MKPTSLGHISLYDSKFKTDNGYWSGDNLQALKQSDTNAYIATDKGEKIHKIPLDASERKLVKAIFTGLVRPEFSYLAINPAI